MGQFPNNSTGALVRNFVNSLTASRATLLAHSVPSQVLSVLTTGYASEGDGGGSRYKRVAAQPSHEGKFRSADRYLPNGSTDNSNGGWWEIDEPKINVKMFGARGDNSTDDTTAILAAAACAGYFVHGNGLGQDYRPTLYFPSCVGYRTTQTIVVPGGVNIVMHAPLWVEAAAGTPIVGMRIADTAVNNQNWRQIHFDLDVRRRTQSDWVSESDVGIQNLNTMNASGIIRRCDGFTIGAQWGGAYHHMILGEFRNNKYGFDYVLGAYNFSTQSTFNGGEFACTNSVNVNVSRYGVRCRSDAAPLFPNTLSFIGQSYELNATGAGSGEAVPVLVSDLKLSRFLQQRCEGNDVPLIRLTGDCRWVTFEDFYNSEASVPSVTAIDDQSTYKIGNRVIKHQTSAAQSVRVFDTGLLGQNFVGYNGTTYYFRGLEFANNTNPATFQPNGSIVSINSDGSVTFKTSGPPNIVGTRLQLNGARSICVEVDTLAGADLTMSAMLFDAAGAQLTADTDLLQDASTPTIAPNTGVYGGLYSTSTNLDYPKRRLDLQFSANVATAFIGLGGGPLFGFRIYARDPAIRPFTGKSQGFTDRLIAAAAPSIGSYAAGAVGMEVLRDPPATGQPKGWVLTAAGAPGTWAPLPNL